MRFYHVSTQNSTKLLIHKSLQIRLFSLKLDKLISMRHRHHDINAYEACLNMLLASTWRLAHEILSNVNWRFKQIHTYQIHKSLQLRLYNVKSGKLISMIHHDHDIISCVECQSVLSTPTWHLAGATLPHVNSRFDQTTDIQISKAYAKVMQVYIDDTSSSWYNCLTGLRDVSDVRFCQISTRDLIKLFTHL